ncbi:MAG: sigma factor-like helix-turn-helix DNA-binding protein [Actinomycetota bacterium]
MIVDRDRTMPDRLTRRLEGVRLAEPSVLRRRLLDDTSATAGAGERRDRDRAAHMLLFLDDPKRVLDLALEHLVAELRTAKGDAGVVDTDDAEYLPSSVFGEPDQVATVAATPLPNHHPVIRAAWEAGGPVAFDRVRANRRLGTLEPVFVELGTTAMLAAPIYRHRVGLGLLCIDESEGERRWTPQAHDRVRHFVDRWLAPILAQSLARQAKQDALTAAERRCVLLLAEGLSYAEIARSLDRSPRTVDNHLRSARRKTNTRNSIELIQVVRRPAG